MIAVISVATTDGHRAFSSDDLAAMQALASEATMALERTRSALALHDALERERLLASIARRLRTELDLHAALAVTVEETAHTLGASRCAVELGSSVLAEWGEQEDGANVTTQAIVVDGQEVGRSRGGALRPHLDDERMQRSSAAVAAEAALAFRLARLLEENRDRLDAADARCCGPRRC